MNRLSSLLLGALAAFTLAGCTNDGGIIGGERGPPVTSVGGIWGGGFLDIATGGGNVTGFIHEGRIALFQGRPFPTAQPDAYFFGTYTDDNQGTLTRYDGIGPVETVSPIQITLATTLNIQVGGPTSLMALQPLADLYDRVAGPDLLSGTWSMTLDGATPYVLTLAFDPINGTLVGSDTPGCNYNGTVEVPDPLHNVYFVNDFIVSEANPGACDGAEGISFASNDPYFGMLGFIDVNPLNNNIIWMLIANQSRAFMLELRRASS